MQPKQLDTFWQKLKDRLGETELKIAEMRKDLLETSEILPTIFRHQMDHAKEEGDLGTRIEVHEKYMTLRDQLRFAMVRISAGTFGKCNSCGNEISLRRLEIQPSTAFCMPCQQYEEARPIIKVKPIAWISASQF